MASADRVYPNPGSGKVWTDHVGRAWRRRGPDGEDVDAKRARRLLRRDDVPLVTWQAGEVTWFEGADVKQAAAEALDASAAEPADIARSEWKSDTGTHLLLLEHLC